jgi:hypothetical protein
LNVLSASLKSARITLREVNAEQCLPEPQTQSAAIDSSGKSPLKIPTASIADQICTLASPASMAADIARVNALAIRHRGKLKMLTDDIEARAAALAKLGFRPPFKKLPKGFTGNNANGIRPPLTNSEIELCYLHLSAIVQEKVLSLGLIESVIVPAPDFDMPGMIAAARHPQSMRKIADNIDQFATKMLHPANNNMAAVGIFKSTMMADGIRTMSKRFQERIGSGNGSAAVLPPMSPGLKGAPIYTPKLREVVPLPAPPPVTLSQ